MEISWIIKNMEMVEWLQNFLLLLVNGKEIKLKDRDILKLNYQNIKAASNKMQNMDSDIKYFIMVIVIEEIIDSENIMEMENIDGLNKMQFSKGILKKEKEKAKEIGKILKEICLLDLINRT